MSEFLKSKMRTWFHIMDFDKDGVISKKDFERRADGLCAQKKHDPVYQEEVRKIYDEHWLACSGSTKTNEKRLLTEAVLIDSLLKQRNDPKVKAIIRDVGRFFFASLDINNDGYLQVEEFRRALGNVGFPDTSFAENTFKLIDTNHDGKISHDEFSDAFLEFLFSEDEDSPSGGPVNAFQSRFEIWLKYSGSTKTNGKGLLTEAVMIDSLMKQRNDPELKSRIRDICWVFFDSADTNKDGYIDLKEFRRAVSGGGRRDTSFAENTFKLIDTNHDGKISFDEYAHAIVEFLFSEDEDSPHTLFWGCLK